MNTSGWMVSDSPTPAAGGWQVSDSPTPAQPKESLADNPNGEGVYQMRGADGKTVGVPYSKVTQARPQGFEYANDQEMQRFNKDYSADPARNSETTMGAAPTLKDRLTTALRHPLNTLDAVAQPVSRPTNPSMGDTAAADARNVAAGAAQVVRHPINTLVKPLFSGATAPMNPDETVQVPNELRDLAEQANTNGPQFGAQMIGQGLATAGIAKAIPAAADFAGSVKEEIAAGKPTPPGVNHTPKQQDALSGVLARGNGMGKDFFPQDVSESIASPIRQAAADHPELAKVIQEGTPKDAMGAFQSILDKAKEKIDVAHQQALQSAKSTPFNMAQVQQEVQFPQSLEGFAPEDAASIAELRKRLGTVNTLEGANDLRKWLNNELAPQFRKSDAAAGRSGAVTKALEDARSALRDQYYQQLEKATGQDFSGLKRTEGGIIKAQESMQNAAPNLASKEALAREPKGLKEMLADALKGGRTIRGGPIAGTANLIAERALGSTPLGEVQEGLRRTFSDLPEPTPATLPEFNRPQLAAPQPGAQPFTVENAGQGPEPDAGSMAGVPVREPAPAAVTPEPAPTLQLTAAASPDGNGVPPPPTWNAPPALNEATARTRVQPIPDNPQPTPPSPAGFTIGPDGTAQRAPAGALPAPAPKVRPAMAHIAGEVTGIDEATGLPIVRRKSPAATEPNGGAAPAQVAAEPPAQGSLPLEQPRPVVQASANPDELRASAAEQKPVMQQMAEKAVEGVPGAEVEGMRVKDADSVANKAERGKPPETITDHLGARVSAPTPEAVEQVKQNVESQLPVAQADKITNNGIDADQYALKTGKPGEANQQSELQVVTKPTADALKATDDLYEQQKDALAKGDKAEAERIGKQIEAKVEAAKGETSEPRYKFGNTQHNIGADTEASKALDQMRSKIAPEDAAGDGKDVGAGGNHVTVRYGIQGDDTSGIRAFLEKQAPFDAKLGPLSSFPPSPNSNGAAVLVAPVESPELRRLNSEIEKHGDFKSSDFPDYKPHATVAYVKPESVSKYTGDQTTAGKTFRVDSVSISDRNGDHVDVPLKGSAQSSLRDRLAQKAQVAEADASHSSPSIEGAKQEVKPGAWQKGDRVTLPDGRAGTVQFYDGKITKNARVLADDGKMVSSVKGAELKPTQQHVDTEPIGNPIPERAQQIKDEISKGTDVRIFSARVANDPEGTVRAKIQKWTEDHLGQKLPVTNMKDDGMAFLLDDKANVTPNAHEPFQIPDIPKGKWLGVDLDKTLAEDTRARSGNSGGASANAEAKGSGNVPAQREAAATGTAAGNPAGTATGSAAKDALDASSGGAQKEVLAPGSVGKMPVSDLNLDPKRFQFKLNTDSSGVTNLLKGRKWNDDLAGVVTGWKDPADGRTYVINGHHRVQLARENGASNLAVRMLDAKDAGEARAIGALQNIAEGRGTAIDAAKFMRDTGLTPDDLDKKGISMGEATAANGVALSRLAPKLFDDAVSGKLKQGRAIAIGNATDVPEEQQAILKLIQRKELGGHRVPDDVVDELARMAKSAGTHTETQQTLFGAEEMRRNLALEKAEVSAYVRQQIQQEKRLFGSVSDENKAERLGKAGNKIDAAKNAEIAQQAAQAHELYDKLSTRSGEIDDILNEAAGGLAKGKAGVKADAYERVREALSKTLSGGQGPGAGAVQADTAGPAAGGTPGKG